MKIFTRKIVAVGLFTALQVILSGTSIPVGATRIMPLQHTLNVAVGILLGPWHAAIAAFFTAVIRLSLGTGTIFAFPGGIFGGFVVGYVYLLTGRDLAAFTEPVGTALIGGTLSGLLFAPTVGSGGGVLFFIYLFAASSVPGSILGYFLIKSLRAAGAETFFCSSSSTAS